MCMDMGCKCNMENHIGAHLDECSKSNGLVKSS